MRSSLAMQEEEWGVGWGGGRTFLSVRWGLVTRLVIGYKCEDEMMLVHKFSSLKPHPLKSQIMKDRGLIGLWAVWCGIRVSE